MSERIETFRYDDKTVRLFVHATVFWAIVGMGMGVVIASLLFMPNLNFAPYFTFGRLRPIHTNAVIFAFCANIIFAGVYYSTQRLLKARMFSDLLSKIHFWGWQLLIVVGALCLLFGHTQAKEYAELPWTLDLVLAFLWIVFAINFFGTIVKRREPHLYVAIWFYIATIITVAMLHIFNSLAVPYSLLGSYSLYSGVHDALIQWWYGHNAVAFVFTTPFLGLMYYYLPKAAQRPVFSYRLSILHFWALIFVYIWAGPHHLHYTALPGWASTLGMVFSVVLWVPSWGGMINGLLTLRGAWHKLREDPILKFLVLGVTFYGMSTFEGPVLAVKSVNALSHYTDWTIGHVHSGVLGWNGFIAFGTLYWMLPRLYKTKLHSVKLAEIHFWIGTVGIVSYMVAMWVAGIWEGLMWSAFEVDGRLVYPEFIETALKLTPMYWLRLVGGIFYLSGVFLMTYNLYRTIASAPEGYDEEPEVRAPARARDFDPRVPEAALAHGPRSMDAALYRVQQWFGHGFHRALERMPVTFTVLVVLAVSVGSAVEAVPLFLVGENVPKIASVKPYTPLELLGRDIYLREGCYLCHSQMVRPFRHETERYGEYSKPGEFVYDHPFQWGSKRTGPDLHRVGEKYPHLWHVRHMEQPPSTTPGSLMPAFPHILADDLDLSEIQAKMRAMVRLGVPYTDADIEHALESIQEQAQNIADEVVAQTGPEGLAKKEIMALTAYLQRLGMDIRWRETGLQPLTIQTESVGNDAK